MKTKEKEATVSSELHRSKINTVVACILWGAAAGRCEICNVPLSYDGKYGIRNNYAQLAHIHAVGKNGPRHKDDMTQEELNNVDNLMLLCPQHHYLIDHNPEKFKSDELIKKKKKHEERIKLVTEIPNDSSCKLVTYFSNIDNIEDYSNTDSLKRAVINSNMYSRGDYPLELHAGLVTKYEPNKAAFDYQANMLERKVKEYFNDIIKTNEKIALFALAPQPLLFKLGSLLCDQLHIAVYQCHRNIDKWVWPEDKSVVEFIIKHTYKKSNTNIALVIDLSAEVIDERITSVLGMESSIYHLTIMSPNRNFVTNLQIQDKFVESFRNLMETIKKENPNAEELHVFPVMPTSLAVRAGMDYMPKTDLTLIVYEQFKQSEGFFEALTIGG